MSRGKFFFIAMICSFCYYVFPGYLFSTLTSISWVCWVWPRSVTAQQIGSGMDGLGLGAFSLDWSAIEAFLYSPLVSPFFAIVNVLMGYILVVYFAVPLAYWGTNAYNAKTFPIFSSDLFDAQGQSYNITAIVNNRFELDQTAYEKNGQIHMSMFFALSCGFGFAAIASTVTHVSLFYGREIWQRATACRSSPPDIHTKLMRKYEDIPQWRFYVLLTATVAVSFALCEIYKEQVQLPWWGLILACALASLFTLPISVITATTNQTPGLNIITEYIMGYILPGKPIANVCFKLIGTIVAGTVNLGVAWWLLNSIENICQESLLRPHSSWTCPGSKVASSSNANAAALITIPDSKVVSSSNANAAAPIPDSKVASSSNANGPAPGPAPIIIPGRKVL